MQLFIDSADPAQIEEAWNWGFVDGVTTNPSLAAKIGKPYGDIVAEILKVVNGPVSLEVVATETDEMISQAHRLAKLGSQVFVKLPATIPGLQACKKLRREGIKTNMTLVFSTSQGLAVAKAQANYVSPFVGRLDDISEHSGDDLVAELRDVYDNYHFPTKILAASIRDLGHLEKMATIGADIATVPFDILKDMSSHKLTTIGLERFLADWDKAHLELPA